MKKVNQPSGVKSQIAAKWGCSKPYISKCVKAGMPTDSIEAADAWRRANSKEGMGHKSRHGKPITISTPVRVSDPPPQPPPLQTEGDCDIESMAVRARESEQQAYAALRDLQNLARGIDQTGQMSQAEVEAQRQIALGLVPGALRSYTQASKGRLDVEKKLTKELEARGQLAQVDEIWEMVQDILGSLVDSLKMLPRQVSLRANPSNPTHAEAAIAEEVNILITRASKIVTRIKTEVVK